MSTHISHTINKLTNKISKLEEELKVAMDADKFKEYGELIMSNLYQLPKENMREVSVLNYYTNEMITFPLDPQLNAKENAQKYFKKYSKLTYLNSIFIDFYKFN